jgi:hypothetical protein
MWSALGKMTGWTYEQPPYDCAWPLKDVGDLSGAHEIADTHYKQINELHADAQWTMIEGYADPDGLDMKLFTRPQIGTYHMLKATFTLQGVTADQFINLVGSSKLELRQKFSADCTGLKKIDEPTPVTELVHATYWAPPPVAGRDFCFLVGRRDNGDGSSDLWGCSVASPQCEDVSGMTLVRGASLWGWKLIQAGDNLLVSYANCFDPRGWTPGFLLAWMKTTAAKEFCAIRAVLTGKEVKVEKVDLAEAGVSADDVAAEVKQQNEAEKK